MERAVRSSAVLRVLVKSILVRPFSTRSARWDLTQKGRPGLHSNTVLWSKVLLGQALGSALGAGGLGGYMIISW